MNREKGSAGLVVAAGSLVALVVALLLIDLAHLYVARATLTTAADAAALAAAPVTFSPFGTDGDPRRAAASLASANGAELIGCDCRIDRTWNPRRVSVTVAADVDLALLGDRRLTARSAAEFRPVDMALESGYTAVGRASFSIADR